jgi:leucyl aminopeptidase (aminopeptidase T)
MADQSISCPSCGKKIPLTRALRAEIEASLKQQFDETLQDRERELRAKYESRLEEDLQRAQADAAKKAEKKVAQELAGLKSQVKDQAKDLEEARRLELSMRKKERELERKQQELELTVAREIDKERTRLVTDTQERLAEEHRLKDAEKERQLGDMRRQIEDLKRKRSHSPPGQT